MIQEPPFSSAPITWPGHHGRVQVSSADSSDDRRDDRRDDSDESRRHGGMGTGSQEANTISMFYWLRNGEVYVC